MDDLSSLKLMSLCIVSKAFPLTLTHCAQGRERTEMFTLFALRRGNQWDCGYFVRRFPGGLSDVIDDFPWNRIVSAQSIGFSLPGPLNALFDGLAVKC